VNDGAGHLSLVADGPWAGWLSWADRVPGTFLDAIGVSYSRSDAPGRATVMVATLPSHNNRMDALHGGFLASFADHAYFAGLCAMGRLEQAGAVTVDLNMQYCGSGRIGVDLRAEIELLRETGRLIFMRLTLWQEDVLVAASSATFRKASASK